MRFLASLFTYCLFSLIAAPLGWSTIIKRKVPDAALPERVGGAQTSDGRKALTLSPENEAAYVGATVVLKCEANTVSPDARIMWWEFTTGNAQLISDGYDITGANPNAARYRIISETPTQFYLEISDVVLGDGGTYQCIDQLAVEPDTYVGQADLIVIESTMNCSTLVGADNIVMDRQNYTNQCELRYRGGFAPKLTWSGPEPFRGPIEIVTDTDVFSGIGYTVQRSFDIQYYAVVSAFEELGDTPAGVASNAPNLTESFQFNPLYVYWGPRDLVAIPTKPIYTVGEIITCEADAFPPAFFLWQNMVTFEIFYSQLFTVTEDMVGFSTTLRCQAQNLVQGFIYSQNLFIDVFLPPRTTTTTVAPTTTPPLDAPCTNLTGWWLSASPYAELFLNVTTDGRVVGGMRNFTDQYTVEVAGRTRMSDYAYIGLTLIYPFNKGLLGLTGECHRCSGVEVLIVESIWRSITDSAGCGDGGTPGPSTAYEFRRWEGGLTPGSLSYEPLAANIK